MMLFIRAQSEAAVAAFGDKVNARVRKNADGVYQVKPTNRGYGAPVSDTAPTEVGFVKGDSLDMVEGAVEGALDGTLGNWSLQAASRGWFTLVAGGDDVSVTPAPVVAVAEEVAAVVE